MASLQQSLQSSKAAELGLSSSAEPLDAQEAAALLSALPPSFSQSCQAVAELPLASQYTLAKDLATAVQRAQKQHQRLLQMEIAQLHSGHSSTPGGSSG